MRTDTRATEAPREAPRGSRSGRHRVRRRGGFLRFVGWLLVSAGIVLGAFIAWVLWGTGLFTAQEQGTLRDELAEAIESGRPGAPPLPVPGDAYGVLQIERMELNSVVVQGTDLESLQRGPGHYVTTDHPWNEKGRVGIAGHRTTYGAPFWDLDELRRGDLITLVTPRGTFYWELTRLKVVEPQNVGVLRAPASAGGGVRIGPGKKADALGPSLVLTTCHPRFSAAQRLIAFAQMVEAPEDSRRLPSDVLRPQQPLFSDPDQLLRVVWVGTGAAALVAIALAVVGAFGRRRRRAA